MNDDRLSTVKRAHVCNNLRLSMNKLNTIQWQNGVVLTGLFHPVSSLLPGL